MVAGACLWLASNLQRSRWGRGLLAVRESWVAAESLGVSRYRMETMAFALSAALAGLGGALFAAQNAYIAPNIFAFDLSILMLLFVILGGLGTVWGAAHRNRGAPRHSRAHRRLHPGAPRDSTER